MQEAAVEDCIGGQKTAQTTIASGMEVPEALMEILTKSLNNLNTCGPW